MISFLADENISPETATFLETLGYACHSLRRDGPRRLPDRAIIDLAIRDDGVIFTHDLDFGKTAIPHLPRGHRLDGYATLSYSRAYGI